MQHGDIVSVDLLLFSWDSQVAGLLLQFLSCPFIRAVELMGTAEVLLDLSSAAHLSGLSQLASSSVQLDSHLLPFVLTFDFLMLVETGIKFYNHLILHMKPDTSPISLMMSSFDFWQQS